MLLVAYLVGSNFLPYCAVLSILFYFVIPKSSAINTWIGVKNWVQIRFERDIYTLRSKVFMRDYLEYQLEIAQEEVLRLKTELNFKDIQLSDYQDIDEFIRFLPHQHKFHTSKILKIYNNEFDNPIIYFWWL